MEQYLKEQLDYLFENIKTLSEMDILFIKGNYLKRLLSMEEIACRACRYLSYEQLKSIPQKNYGWIGLCEFYRQHLLHDYSDNYDNELERKFYEEEALRLGWVLSKSKYSYSIKDKERENETTKTTE
jgi:hypothetical protein